MVDSDLQKAKAALAIQDVYLCDAKVWADRRLDPSLVMPNLNVQFKLSPTNEAQILELAATPTESAQPAPRYLVRYFVGTGLRILHANADATSNELTQDDLIADIEATFIVKYAVFSPEQPTQEMLTAFNDHAVHHMWPYWREFLQATTLRLRVPPVVLPMRVLSPTPNPDQQTPMPPK